MARKYKAKRTFLVLGSIVAEGAVLNEGHPAVLGREHLFEVIEETPAPAKRGPGRPPKSRA